MDLLPIEGENHIGILSMQSAASNNLILTDSSSFGPLAEVAKRFSHGGFYQVIARTLVADFRTSQALSGFATKLASIADHAHLRRDYDLVAYAGHLLLSLGLSRQSESVGHYYQALSLSRSARGDIAGAESLFQEVADNALFQYRARAMLALGTNSVAVSDLHSAASFYREVANLLTRQRILDPMTLYLASRMTAVIRAMDGDHRGALAHLEKMLPLARMASSVQPYAYYDYLNTLAVELTEAGRLEEARNASRIVLASPFARAYPEWRETREEIELRGLRASRAVVAFKQRISESESRLSHELGANHSRPVGDPTASEPGKLLRLPVPERARNLAAESSPASQPARVLDMQEWKNKMTKQDERPHRPATNEEKEARLKDLEKLQSREVLIKIMENLGDERISDSQLLRALMILEDLEPDENPGA